MTVGCAIKSLRSTVSKACRGSLLLLSVDPIELPAVLRNKPARSCVPFPGEQKKRAHERPLMKTSGSVADARNAGANARYGLRLDLRGPLTVDGLRSANARQIERKVGDVDPVALPDQARREQQPDG